VKSIALLPTTGCLAHSGLATHATMTTAHLIII